MANIPGLKSELLNLFSTTSNLTAQEKQRRRDRIVAEHPAQWQAYLNGGGTDTPANRGSFAADMTIEWWRRIYRDQDRREKVAAIVAETL